MFFMNNFRRKLTLNICDKIQRMFSLARNCNKKKWTMVPLPVGGPVDVDNDEDQWFWFADGIRVGDFMGFQRKKFSNHCVCNKACRGNVCLQALWRNSAALLKPTWAGCRPGGLRFDGSLQGQRRLPFYGK